MSVRRWVVVIALVVVLCLATSPLMARELIIASWRSTAGEEIALFKEAYPEIEVQHILIPDSNIGYVERVTAMFVAGTPPDVMWVKPDVIIPPMVEQGMLEDLRGWIERTPDFNPAHFHPFAMEGPFDMITFVPYTAMPYPVYYERNVLMAAGVAEPKSGWTFDDFRSTLRKITRRAPDGRVELYGYDDIGRTWQFFGHKGAAGKQLFDDTGTKVTADNPTTIAGYEFFHALIWEDGTIAGPGIEARMTNGRAAMSIWGPEVFLDRVDSGEVGLVSLPVGPGGYAPFVLVEGWAMAAPSTNKEDAWRFITMMTGPEMQRRFAELGGAPGNLPVLIEHGFRSHPYRDALIEIVSQGQQYLGIPLGTQVPFGVLSEANSKFNIGAYWRNEKSLRAVIDEAVPVMQRIIDNWLESQR